MKTISKPLASREESEYELRALLDQELSRRPDRYRVPLILCELQGCSRREAARRLALPEGTLSSRLATAKKMLARRLARHGLTFSTGALAFALLASGGTATSKPNEVMMWQGERSTPMGDA